MCDNDDVCCPGLKGWCLLCWLNLIEHVEMLEAQMGEFLCNWKIGSCF